MVVILMSKEQRRRLWICCWEGREHGWASWSLRVQGSSKSQQPGQTLFLGSVLTSGKILSHQAFTAAPLCFPLVWLPPLTNLSLHPVRPSSAAYSLRSVHTFLCPSGHLEEQSTCCGSFPASHLFLTPSAMWLQKVQ